MIRILIVLPIFWNAVLTWSTYKDETSLEAQCKAGEMIRNSCLECVCTENYVFNCTEIPCTKHTGIKQSKKLECQPQIVYVHNEMTCMCQKNGRWPHKRCRNVFNTMPTKQTCIPNSYVVEDCNICPCGPTGKITRSHCTQNNCSELIKRRSGKLNNVLGSCEPKNWYSLAPCQFCYCVHGNQLVCSTGNNNKLSKPLELGIYNLTECGKQMMTEVMELVPELQKSLRQRKLATTQMTTKTKSHKAYEKITSKTMDLKSTSSYTTKKKVTKLDQSEQGVQEGYKGEITKSVDLIDNKDDDSDSSDSDDDDVNPSTPASSKLTENPFKQPLPYVLSTNSFDQDDDTSAETVVSDKPKIAEETTAMSVQDEASEYNQRLNIPISAKITFENAGSQQIKTKLANALSGKPNDVYKINIPSMLDKLMSMTMKRRYMVQLNAQSNCVPGQTTKQGCNNCYCLVNGKLLCTYKPCNESNSEPQ